MHEPEPRVAAPLSVQSREPAEASVAPSWPRIALEQLSQPAILLCVVHLSILAFEMPVLDALPAWFYQRHHKLLGPPALLIVLALAPLFALLAVRALERRTLSALSFLIVFGFFYQHALGWSEGRGLDGLREQIVSSGHGEFAYMAIKQSDTWRVLVNYEAMVTHGELGEYATTKPPGTLLFYAVNEHISRGLSPTPDRQARLEALRDFATVFWPLVSYSVLVPLFLLVRRMFDRETAFLACVLYLFVPGSALMVLHLDSVLFPTLVVAVCVCAQRAASEGRLSWAWLSGALLYLAGFFSFALFFAAPLALGVAAGEVRSAKYGWRGVVRLGLVALAGFVCMAVSFRLAFGYNFVTRMQAASLAHAEWKRWDDSAVNATVYFAWLDYLEFATWLGIPLAACTFAYARRQLLAACDGRASVTSWLALALACSLLVLGFFGHTKAEAGRLWLFLVPFCCCFAAHDLRTASPRARTAALGLFLGLQSLTTLLIKAHQDFR
jgi:hypothetical protein